MSSSYLDKFRSTLPSSQGKQILQILSEKSNSGEIKNINDFKSKLKELTTKILAERITPTLEIYRAIANQDISSEQFNEMLKRIKNDLETGFNEADNLDEIIDAHNNLIDNVALKTLRYGINEIENKITLYEFLNQDKNGFTDTLFNTFTESKPLQTDRSDKNSLSLFFDPRTDTLIEADEDASVNIVGENLTLGSNDNQYITIVSADWLANVNSIRSELDVSFKSSNISNILDNSINTFWVVSILLSQLRIGGTPAEIALRLNGSQDINFIEIEPATPYPMYLEGIEYYDSTKTRQTIDFDGIYLNKPTRINFNKINTSTIILKIKQQHYKVIQFLQNPGESNFDKAVLNETKNEIDLVSINETLKEVLTSDFILKDIIKVKDAAFEQKKYFEYLIGFDNVRVGLSLYDERSIFVSSKKTIENPLQFSLKTNEYLATQQIGETGIEFVKQNYLPASTDENNKFYHSVFEYWLYARFYDENNSLISSDYIPVLPLGAQRIYHEKLIFTKKDELQIYNNLSELMHFTEADETDVKVYRNGTILSYGTNWEFILDTDNSDLTRIVPDSGKRMSRGIRIFDAVNPLDFFTVSYTPTITNTNNKDYNANLLKIVDLNGDNTCRVINNNLIVFDSLRKSYKIKKADFYLMIIIRRNSNNPNISSRLEDYLELFGTRNLNKF